AVTRHERPPLARAEAARAGFAVSLRSIKKNYLGAIAARRLDLRAWRILRHHADGAQGRFTRRQRNRLRMIARRVCDHAASSVGFIQRENFIGRAAHFERARALQILALEKDAPPRRRGERTRGL